jgi:hypothetical protein
MLTGPEYSNGTFHARDAESVTFDDIHPLYVHDTCI